METQHRTPLRFAPAIASLLLAIGVVTVFSACGLKDDGTWMRCHAAQDAIMWVAIALAVALAVAAFVRQRAAGIILYAVGVFGSVAVIAIPGGLMPMCMMQTMRCYTAMQPFSRIMGVIILILCVVSIFQLLRGASRVR